MKKLLVIGKEGRLARYTADSSLFDRYDIVYVPVGTDDGTILELHSDANYILVDAVADVSASLIEGMPDLKLIHSEGVGYQGVDTEKAAARGIYVCNCKGMNAAAVAEQAVLLMLGLLRDVKGGDESVRSGKQIETKERYMLEGSLRELGDCTVGLIGMGDIGKATARLLAAFGADVAYFKPRRLSAGEEAEMDVRYMEREQLLASCDIVSLHLPVTEETRYMVDDDFLRKMKDTAYLINTSRGELVDSVSLVKALESGWIAGAGLDTMDGEPVQPDNPLVTAPEDAAGKLLLSCHIGGITGASFRRGYGMIWSAIEKVSREERPDNIVNGL